MEHVMHLREVMKLKFCLAAGLAVLGTNAWAALTVPANSGPLNIAIPSDDLNSGVANTITLANTGIASITSLTVNLDLTGSPTAWNGNYYAYLTHGSSLAVLLNRVGTVDASNPNDFGYADNGFNVTFSDSGYDVHNYQNIVNPANGGQLTGVWSPDGRNISPLSVTAATPRTALLSSFNGLAADGGWTLYILDASSDSSGTLASWGLTVTGAPVPVPESGPGLAGAFGLIVALFVLMRVKRPLKA